MSTTALLAEFLVIGFFPLLAMFFGALLLFGVDDVAFLAYAERYPTITIVTVSFSLYLIGAVTHRLSQLLNSKDIPLLLKMPLLRKKLPLRKSWASFPNFVDDYCIVMQHGSEALIKKIEYSESLARMFKASAATAPMLGITLGTWLALQENWGAAISSFLLSVVYAGVATVAFVLQHKNHMRAIEAGLRLIKEEGQISGRAA